MDKNIKKLNAKKKRFSKIKIIPIILITIAAALYLSFPKIKTALEKEILIDSHAILKENRNLINEILSTKISKAEEVDIKNTIKIQDKKHDITKNYHVLSEEKLSLRLKKFIKRDKEKTFDIIYDYRILDGDKSYQISYENSKKLDDLLDNKKFSFAKIKLKVKDSILDLKSADISLDSEKIDYISDKKLSKITIKEDKSIALSLVVDEKNEIDLSAEDIELNLVITKDKKEILSKNLAKNELAEIYTPNENGLYKYELNLRTNDEKLIQNRNFKFILNVEKPVKFKLSKTKFTQGEMLYLNAFNIKNKEELLITLDEKKLEIYQNGNVYTAVIPSSYYDKAGSKNLHISYGEYKENIQLELVERVFEIQDLKISKAISDRTRTDEAYREFAKYYPAALKKNIYKREEFDMAKWGFVLPSTGFLTTEYGERRFVNGSPTSYRHSGVDIADGTGTRINSTADGMVVMARDLILTGKSVVISHGNNIFSTYYHLDTLDVVENDEIKIGQKIGTMGTTGFSTGPHLHFMISYKNINLEPGFLIYNKEIKYNNYRELFGDMLDE